MPRFSRAAAKSSRRLRRIVPGEGVIDNEIERRAFECDALTAYRQLPMVVVLPETTAQVATVLRYCYRATRSRWCRAAPAPRCPAGPCRSKTACCSGIGKFKRILEIDIANRCAVVQPGVTNLAITQAVQTSGSLLCARPVQPDRLHHRRQCRGEFRRRALPEIRPDHEQCASASNLSPSTGEIVRLGGKHFDAVGL